MSNRELHADVRLGPQGRIVIPARMRGALGIEPGDSLLARVADGRLVIEKPEAVERRLHEYFRNFDGRSLSDELIAERREENRRESDA